MTWHPTEDDLVLHFYEESSREEHARVGSHLETCAPCRASWLDLCDTLRLVDESTAPEPSEGFERVLWARLQPALPKPRAPWWSVAGLLPIAAAAAAAVVIGIVVGPRAWPWHRPAPTAPAAAAKSETAARERVLRAALGEHLETTQTLLVELMNAPDADVSGGSEDLTFVRTTAGELLSSGRLYRVTARQNGDVQFTRILDDLEPVLVDVAHAPEKMDRHDLQSLRTRIDDASLLFKVRAMSNEIRDLEKKSAISE